MPRLTASRAHASAATVAANGVDFFEPLKPALPELPHVTTLPWLSVIVTSVLLNVALMCATPSASTCLRARFVRGPPFFGFAIISSSLSSYRQSLRACPSTCAHWCACADRAPADLCGDADRDRHRCPSNA